MEASKKYMEVNGFGDRISFADMKPHTIKLLKDKEDSIPDGKGGQITGMKYLVEEGGVQKTIFTGSIGLVSKLAECAEGDVVTVVMKKANNKSFYVVVKADGGEIGGGAEEEQAELPLDSKPTF